MAAVAGLIFRFPALQEKPGFLITFLLQVMQQAWIGIGWQLFCQFVNPCEERQQIGFRAGGGHGFNGGVQFTEGLEQFFFNGR